MRDWNSWATRPAHATGLLALVTGLVAGLVTSLAWPTPARGQASPQAEALFRDGKQLMKEGKLGEACAAFEGSERAEHNVATVLSLADCRDKNRQYASAWALFLQADSQTRSDPTKAVLNTTAKRRARELEAKLSYLTINVPDESRIPELVVTRDGALVDPAEWNRAIPADGGSHVIAGKAPGHESWSTTVTLRPEADKQAVEVPRFKALPEIVNKSAHATAARDDGTGDEQPASPPVSQFTQKRKIAIGIAAGGVVVGGGMAVVFGLKANGLHDDALKACPASACTAAGASTARSTNARAISNGHIATAGYAVMGVAIAGGVALWLLGKPESPGQDSQVVIAPQLGASNGVAVMGRF